MSVEVKGFDSGERGAVSEVSFAAAKLCVAQGMSPGEAHTTAELGARYAAELIFTVLGQMDIIPPEGINMDTFVGLTRLVAGESINPRQPLPSS